MKTYNTSLVTEALKNYNKLEELKREWQRKEIERLDRLTKIFRGGYFGNMYKLATVTE